MTKFRLAAIVIAVALIAPLASAAGSGDDSRSHGGPIGMTVKISDARLAPTEDGRAARMYMDVVVYENAKLVPRIRGKQKRWSCAGHVSSTAS